MGIPSLEGFRKRWQHLNFRKISQKGFCMALQKSASLSNVILGRLSNFGKPLEPDPLQAAHFSQALSAAFQERACYYVYVTTSKPKTKNYRQHECVQSFLQPLRWAERLLFSQSVFICEELCRLLSLR